MKFYFNTSIWVDIYDARGINGNIAKKLFEKIILSNSKIIYSDDVIFELKRIDFSDFEINDLLSIAKPSNLERIHPTKIQIQESKKIAKKRNVPRRDALHAILARDYTAILISRDKDFEKLKDIIRAKKPEELI